MLKRKVEVIIYKGIKFRRYPEAKRATHRRYYRPSGTYISKALHQEIWKDCYGKIPAGYHIHHKDGNYSNNSIENLEAITHSKHLSYHRKKYCAENKDEILKHLERIRPLTKEWHASKEGREWHSQHGKNVFGNRPYQTFKCMLCGEIYKSKKPNNNKFCSNKCKSKWRRESGVDDVTRECIVCGVSFNINHYRKTQVCGNACSRRKSL